MAQQTLIKNENLSWSANNESHIRSTSGNGNSCDNNKVNHLKRNQKEKLITWFSVSVH